MNDYFAKHLWEEIKYMALEKIEEINTANLVTEGYDCGYFN